MAKTHGLSRTPEHNSWRKMRERCLQPHSDHYKWYGARGIKICERWKDSFLSFLSDMGPRPPETTLDRINTDGDYTPENCRWANKTDQVRGQRKTKFVLVDGEKIVLSEFAERHGLNRDTVTMRLREGMEVTKVLATKDLRNPIMPSECDDYWLNHSWKQNKQAAMDMGVTIRRIERIRQRKGIKRLYRAVRP